MNSFIWFLFYLILILLLLIGSVFEKCKGQIKLFHIYTYYKSPMEWIVLQNNARKNIFKLTEFIVNQLKANKTILKSKK